MTRSRRPSRPARLAALALVGMTLALASTAFANGPAYVTVLSCLTVLAALVAAIQVDHDDFIGWSTALVVAGVGSLQQAARATAWLPGSIDTGIDSAVIAVLVLAALVVAAWVWHRMIPVAAHPPAESVGFGPCPPV